MDKLLDTTGITRIEFHDELGGRMHFKDYDVFTSHHDDGKTLRITVLPKRLRTRPGVEQAVGDGK